MAIPYMEIVLISITHLNGARTKVSTHHHCFSWRGNGEKCVTISQKKWFLRHFLKKYIYIYSTALVLHAEYGMCLDRV